MFSVAFLRDDSLSGSVHIEVADSGVVSASSDTNKSEGEEFQAGMLHLVGGAVASWLVRSSPDRAVRVRALAGDIVLCSWARHFTLTVPLSTQEYKWVPANCWGNLTNCWGVTCDGLASRPGGVEIPLAAACYRIRDKLRQL